MLGLNYVGSWNATVRNLDFLLLVNQFRSLQEERMIDLIYLVQDPSG